MSRPDPDYIEDEAEVIDLEEEELDEGEDDDYTEVDQPEGATEEPVTGATEEYTEGVESEVAEEITEGADEGDPARRQGGGGNPLALLGALRPRRLVKLVRSQGERLQRVLWALEDGGVFSAKFLAKAAVKAARPLLVGFILSRAMRTVVASSDPLVRMSKLPQEQQLDYYYSQLLGKDWEQQLEQDLVDAVREVDEGLVTDEMVAEKRKLSAAMLRTLEVEEWDKQRMRHYYYGLYGLGPWYWDMEERLHNPFFIGARAWNGPAESWVNENKVYPRDLPPGATDFKEAAIDAIESSRGRPLSERAKQRLRAQETLTGADHVLGGQLLRGVMDPLELRERLEAAAQ